MQPDDMRGVRLRRRLLACAAVTAMIANGGAPAFATGNDNYTASPIKHVIVIIGENRSFDHVFATYKPVSTDTVLNLLSEGIVNADGTPGRNYGMALQYSATDTDVYQITPTKTPYTTLPPALVGGTATPYVCEFLSSSNTGTDCLPQGYVPGTPLPPALAAQLEGIENGLEPDDQYKLLTGGTGQTNRTPDQRVHYDGQTATTLPPGPYQITNNVSSQFPYPYDSYGPSPVHRFMQMQQQLDCDASKAKTGVSSGCASDLYAWVEVTVGAGSNGKAQPAGFNNESTGEGSTALGFFNVQQGDVPYFKWLADHYSMSDNFHQSVKGGTGANHIMLGSGDAIFFTNRDGNATVPPHNPVNPQMPGTPVVGKTAISEIENPNPQPGTNNYYTQDGYGGGSGSPAATSPNANYGGGSYVNCADPTQPGVGLQLDYLNALPNPVNPNCAPGDYYLVNNYNPGYFGNGADAFKDTNPNNYVYTVPPSSVPTIGDLLLANNISWAYYGDQFDEYLKDPYGYSLNNEYCNICNWAQYDTAIMTNDAVRKTHLRDSSQLYIALGNNTLPAVSYVKPSGITDGHPASSKLSLFEAFSKKIVDAVQANPTLAANTAIIITFDEGGGYWDSGYVQPLDFFGDGTRIPTIVVSPFSTGGHISHTYADHVSILKFIERNWGIGTISPRSRDNLHNPVMGKNPYVPVNAPALGDMWDMFDFNN